MKLYDSDPVGRSIESYEKLCLHLLKRKGGEELIITYNNDDDNNKDVIINPHKRGEGGWQLKREELQLTPFTAHYELQGLEWVGHNISNR